MFGKFSFDNLAMFDDNVFDLISKAPEFDALIISQHHKDPGLFKQGEFSNLYNSCFIITKNGLKHIYEKNDVSEIKVQIYRYNYLSNKYNGYYSYADSSRDEETKWIVNNVVLN